MGPRPGVLLVGDLEGDLGLGFFLSEVCSWSCSDSDSSVVLLVVVLLRVRLRGVGTGVWLGMGESFCITVS